jgi:hypothetical protein
MRGFAVSLDPREIGNTVVSSLIVSALLGVGSGFMGHLKANGFLPGQLAVLAALPWWLAAVLGFGAAFVVSWAIVGAAQAARRRSQTIATANSTPPSPQINQIPNRRTSTEASMTSPGNLDTNRPRATTAYEGRALPAAMRFGSAINRIMSNSSLSWTLKQFLDARESQHPNTIERERAQRPSTAWPSRTVFFSDAWGAAKYDTDTVERYMNQYYNLVRQACACAPGDPGYDEHLQALVGIGVNTVDDIWAVYRHVKALHG